MYVRLVAFQPDVSTLVKYNFEVVSIISYFFITKNSCGLCDIHIEC